MLSSLTSINILQLSIRRLGSLVFIRLRQRIHSVQAVFNADDCSKSMIKFLTK